MTDLANERQIQIEHHLRGKVSFEFNNMSEDECEIEISWGDWKHSHLYLKFLMEEIGWQEISEVETETDGSDCYSSIHFFQFVS